VAVGVPKEKKEAAKNLRLILDAKTSASYLGEAWDREDVKRVAKICKAFSGWCRSNLKR